jgi:hypothetical protein
MKTETAEIRQYLQPVFGIRPWRVKLGVGSFLTFDFGPRIREDRHFHGKWHLWIYLSNWELVHGGHRLVDSDADRRRIAICTRRLEGMPLTGVDFDSRTHKTIFSFDDFRLLVSPADYLHGTDDRDNYWMFFMPDNEVLAAGPSGICLERASDQHSSVDRRTQDAETDAVAARRQVRLED